ncbi:MAG: helical backbone metal receptor [Xanthomonadaceae bacterium]|nr:helical backbone metal receptor [Xanthomonadaceae bacterium]
MKPGVAVVLAGLGLGALVLVLLLRLQTPEAGLPSQATAEPSVQPKIVSLAPHLTELAFDAGLGERMAGAVEWSDYPPAAHTLPRIGDAFRFDLERIVRLRASHALAWAGGTPSQAIDELRALGIEVRVISIRTLDDIAMTIETLGSLAAEPATAAARAKAFRDRVASFKAAQPASGAKIPVFYQVSEKPLFTLGGRHVINQVFELCGARNVFADLDAEAASVDLEAVLARNPAAMIAGAAAGQPDPLAHWHRYRGLRAARCGHFSAVDPDLLVRPTARLLDGAARLCDWLDTNIRQAQDPACAFDDH